MGAIITFIFIAWVFSKIWTPRSRVVTRPSPDTDRPTER